MGMGIVGEAEFNKELERVVPSNNGNHEIEHNEGGQIVDIVKGRGKNNFEVPNGLRKIIGEESVLNGRESALELAKQFGVSPSSVSAYDNGSTSTSSYNKQPNIDHLNDARLRVAKKARGKLMLALSKITSDKLDIGAKDLASVAKDMSVVIRNMEPESVKNPSERSNAPTFVFYAPQMKQESTFETIYVKE